MVLPIGCLVCASETGAIGVFDRFGRLYSPAKLLDFRNRVCKFVVRVGIEFASFAAPVAKGKP